MSFPPSAACKFLDLPPVNLRNLHLHLTKNPFAGRPPHLCGVALTKSPLCLRRVCRAVKGGLAAQGSDRQKSSPAALFSEWFRRSPNAPPVRMLRTAKGTFAFAGQPGDRIPLRGAAAPRIAFRIGAPDRLEKRRRRRRCRGFRGGAPKPYAAALSRRSTASGR